MRRFSNGFFAVSSIATNSVSATAATTANRTMKGEPNQSSLLPSSSTVCSAASPIAMVTMPAQSPSPSSDNFMGVDSSETYSMAIMIAPGTTLT